MELENVQRKEKKETVVHIRITKEQSVWLAKKNVSPALLFYEALEEIMNKSK